MSAGNLREHDEIKQRVADCRERLRRARAAQRTTTSSREMKTSAASDNEDEDAADTGDLIAEEEAKV